MITILLPDSGPLYEAVWRRRRTDEPLPKAALRILRESLLPRPPVPAAPILTFVEVLDEH